MDQQAINKQYAELQIPQENIPLYTNPYEFSERFRFCSTLKYDIQTYSSATSSDQIEVIKNAQLE